MPDSQDQRRFVLATIAWGGALGLLGLAAGWFATNHAARASAALAAGTLAAGVGTGLVVVGVVRAQRAARQGLELVARSGQSVRGEDLAAALDAMVGPSSRWRRPLQAVCALFADLQNRAAEADAQRAAAEVRSRRFEARSEQLSAILATLPEPVIVTNGYDEVVLTNASARQVLGLPDQDEQAPLDRLAHCEKLVALLADTRRRRTTTQRSGEMELADGQGATRSYSITARSLAAATASGAGDAAPAGAVAVLHDISGQKAVQKRNAEFVSAVSHEMKTPLAGIKAYVELLADGDAETDEAREEFLSVIDGQADRLQRLVDNLLNLSRIEAGVVAVNKQPRSLNELLEEALRLVQPAAEAKQQNLVSDLSPLYLGVRADRDLLLQAAINLLSNAIKYTPHQGQIVLRSRLVGADARWEVADTGVGLSPEDCQRVFEKFYRVQKTKDMAAGTGLGLPLAKHIVEDVHGGKLTVESTLGQGSTFMVTLPSTGQLN
jgi:two-component system phosphate regulon sensor histidine kinase PhoR